MDNFNMETLDHIFICYTGDRNKEFNDVAAIASIMTATVWELNILFAVSLEIDVDNNKILEYIWDMVSEYIKNSDMVFIDRYRLIKWYAAKIVRYTKHNISHDKIMQLGHRAGMKYGSIDMGYTNWLTVSTANSLYYMVSNIEQLKLNDIAVNIKEYCNNL